VQRVLDEPDERDRAGEREHEGEAILDQSRDMAAPRRGLFARNPGRRSPFGWGIIRRSLGTAESGCVGPVDQRVHRHDVLSCQPELLILRPGDFRDDDMSAPADLDIGSAPRRRCALDQQAFGRDVADADVEPAGILLQARRNKNLPAKVPPLVRLC